MAGVCGYPLQETFIKTFCFYYFALLTLGYNSNMHHNVCEKSQQVLDGYTSGSAVIKHQNPARANMLQDCKVKADHLLQSIHIGQQHI